MSHIRLAQSPYSANYRYYHDSVVVDVASDNMAVNRALQLTLLFTLTELITLSLYSLFPGVSQYKYSLSVDIYRNSGLREQQ